MEFSVLITARDEAPYLQRALRSAALAAGDRSYELLLSDDGSSDRTAALAARLAETLPLTYFRDPPAATRAEARNRAMERAHGDWLVFLEPEDMLLPGHLAQLVCPDPEVRVCWGAWEEELPDGTLRSREPHYAWPPDSWPPLGAALFSRRLFQAGLRFLPTLPVCEELDWYLQLRAHHSGDWLSPVPAYRRSAPRPGSTEYDLEVWTQYIWRRRKAAF